MKKKRKEGEKGDGDDDRDMESLYTKLPLCSQFS